MSKETMHCHTALPANIINNCLQYFVISVRDCRIVQDCHVKDLAAPQNSKIFFARKWKTKLGTFNIALNLNSNDYI